MNESGQNKVFENKDYIRTVMSFVLVHLNIDSVSFFLSNNSLSLDPKNVVDYFCCYPISLLSDSYSNRSFAQFNEFCNSCQKHGFPGTGEIDCFGRFKSNWLLGNKHLDQNTEERKV